MPERRLYLNELNVFDLKKEIPDLSIIQNSWGGEYQNKIYKGQEKNYEKFLNFIDNLGNYKIYDVELKYNEDCLIQSILMLNEFNNLLNKTSIKDVVVKKNSELLYDGSYECFKKSNLTPGFIKHVEKKYPDYVIWYQNDWKKPSEIKLNDAISKTIEK